jgi:hypothetical protein
MKTTRIEWQEQRRGECGGWELFDVIADRDATDKTGWAFYEKTSWDLTWIRIAATPCRLAKASIEEQRMESRIRHASFHMPALLGVRRNPECVCGVGGKRSQKRGCGKSQLAVHVPPAHLDRRMGHASPAHRARRAAKGLLEARGVERELAAATDACELALASTEDDPQGPERSRRVSCPGGL